MKPINGINTKTFLPALSDQEPNNNTIIIGGMPYNKVEIIDLAIKIMQSVHLQVHAG